MSDGEEALSAWGEDATAESAFSVCPPSRIIIDLGNTPFAGAVGVLL